MHSDAHITELSLGEGLVVPMQRVCRAVKRACLSAGRLLIGLAAEFIKLLNYFVEMMVC